METSSQDQIDKGVKSLRKGDTLVALVHFENAFRLDPTPVVKSGLAYCLAKERRQFQKARLLCQKALSEEPGNPDHYFQLGRIYLLAGQKNNAIAVFRKGLKHKRYQPIIDELHRLGIRKPPVFKSLSREHILNRSVGKLLTKIGNR
jgi:tetratricopeptide (TPR) repeat protein